MKKGLKMNVNRKDDAIILEFPDVQEQPKRKGEIPGIFKELGSRIKSAKPYLEHRAEESAQELELTDIEDVVKMQSYVQNHPEEVSLRAFRNHYNFRLAPEDIGAQILLDFGEYVRHNLERCAPIFNGKIGEKTEVKFWLYRGESLKTLEVLATGMQEWEVGILKHTDAKVRGLLHPQFSSRNQVVDMVYSGLLMGAAKEFFEYSFSSMCGIPKIKVEGTKKDWEQIRAMVNGLGSLSELKEIADYYSWANETVLGGIIGLYDGKEDFAFWKSLVKHDEFSGDEGLSAGWLPSLNLYAAEGKLLPMGQRWTHKNQPRQCNHLQVPVVSVVLVSDNSVGVGNVDPMLEAKIGFTSTSFNNGYLKPVLGIDAYKVKE
jgi:hypothetical protein